MTKPISAPGASDALRSAVGGEVETRPVRRLPRVGSVLAVCAHPDDETFGLGALLGALDDQGSRVSVICFTHGEVSTLGPAPEELRELRAEELAGAAVALGVDRVELCDHPDGRLTEVPLSSLTAPVGRLLAETEPDFLLVFDEGGITGHPDHRRATAAALAATAHVALPVLAWALPEKVAARLNAEFGTAFVGRADPELDLVVEVDRARQCRAISCHASQSADNTVLWRRLELQGDKEALRWLRPPRRGNRSLNTRPCSRGASQLGTRANGSRGVRGGSGAVQAEGEGKEHKEDVC